MCLNNNNLLKNINLDFWKFIEDNQNTSPISLRLKYRDNFAFNVSFAIDQIEARQKTKNKLPNINNNPRFIYPSLLSTEQCTSEAVAAFKDNLFKENYLSMCDLTGGLGIDTLSMARSVKDVTYIERYSDYCLIAEYNFKILGYNNIEVINSDCSDFLTKCNRTYDALYIDPARRGDSNKRLFAFSDCEPDILKLKSRMFEIADTIFIKTSPMADISFSIKELENVSDIYVISYKNECKELLFKLENRERLTENITIHCVDINSDGYNILDFKYVDESGIVGLNYSLPLSYLYEPSSSILKAGAFKFVAAKFKADKLSVNSHLYTSDNYIDKFPGRKFKIDKIILFNNKELKDLNKTLTKANITVRNFPIKAEELRKRLKINDGGDKYIFATTDYSNKKILIICSKV